MSHATATSLCRSTASDAQPPPRQVTFLPPSFSRSFLFPSPHAERVAFCMQGWGENNSPAPFRLGPGGSWPNPVFWAGSGPEENVSFLGRDRPNPVWAEIGPTILGLSPAQWFGPAQPDLILYFIYIYIYYILYYLYIYIYIYI